MKKTFSKGGVHLPEHKDASLDISLRPLPMTAIVPLAQHIGAPASPVVAVGDKVRRYGRIANNSAFVSAGIHSPVTGTVAAITMAAMPDGRSARAIVIKATEEEHLADTADREQYWRDVAAADDRSIIRTTSVETVRECVKRAGIVGLGGATFPSHLKIDGFKSDRNPVLIINGCECEPYLMCDHALMLAFPRQIVDGTALMMKAAGIGRAVIALEDNKPDAAAALRAAAAGCEGIEVCVLKTKYPQGGEKQLIEAVTGRRVPSGKLPASVGALVNNVATAFAVWQSVVMKRPLVERVITVTGDIPQGQRRNYLVPIGTPVGELPFTLPEDAKVILGGPMMGRCAVNLEAPVVKGTSGVTVLAGKHRRPVQACIRCGACVDACPMGLEPYLLSTYGRLRLWAEAKASDVGDCLECGACSYSCPSARPLLDYIRIAKRVANNKP